MTLGDLYPRLRELPGYEAIADREVEQEAVEPPGLPAMARSFLGAMRGLVADGGRLAPREVRKARRAECLACPLHAATPDSCSKCGCGSVVKGGLAAKRAIASSVCPDHPPRWGAV